MKAANRLKKNEDFRNVYKNRKSKANKLLILYIKENNLGFNRAGFTVSKKVGNSVVRSRVKRLMKESYRKNDHRYKQGYDLVFVAREGCSQSDYSKVESAVLHILGLMNMLKST